MSTTEPKFSSKYGVNQKVIQVRVGLHGVESYWGDCLAFPTYMQYPIIRNGDQSWALEFLKSYQFLDADSFLAVS